MDRMRSWTRCRTGCVHGPRCVRGPDAFMETIGLNLLLYSSSYWGPMDDDRRSRRLQRPSNCNSPQGSGGCFLVDLKIVDTVAPFQTGVNRISGEFWSQMAVTEEHKVTIALHRDSSGNYEPSATALRLSHLPLLLSIAALCRTIAVPASSPRLGAAASQAQKVVYKKYAGFQPISASTKSSLLYRRCHRVQQ